MPLMNLPADVSAFAHSPGTPDYDVGAHLFRVPSTPEVVLRPRSAQEVAAAVSACTAAGLTLRVRSGGHGSAPCVDGALIDLSALDDVDVSGTNVWLGAGARWEQVAQALAPHDLVISSGDTGAVGVGGLALGGGIGWLVRSHGLTIDAVRQIEVVTADGVIRTVSAGQDPELFWALRGGGGNFGVVTRFRVEAAPAPALVHVELGYEPWATRALMQTWWQLMADAPETVNATLAVMPAFGPQFPAGALVDMIVDGTSAQAHELLRPLLSLEGLRSQSIEPCRYADLLGPTPPDDLPFTFVGGNRLLSDLGPDTLDHLTDLAGSEVPTMLMLRALGGAYGRFDPEETAFGHREAKVLVVVNALLAQDPPQEAVEAVRAQQASVLDPGAGVYGNFSFDQGPEITAAMYSPATLERLRSVKARVDPSGVFTAAHSLY